MLSQRECARLQGFPVPWAVAIGLGLVLCSSPGSAGFGAPAWVDLWHCGGTIPTCCSISQMIHGAGIFTYKTGSFMG